MVVLDTMMPSEHGLALCQYLGSTTAILIILLTAIAEDTDRSVGLEVGADDYVTQPFNPRELLARIESVIRRTQSLPPGREPVREAFDHAHVHNKPCLLYRGTRWGNRLEYDIRLTLPRCFVDRVKEPISTANLVMPILHPTPPKRAGMGISDRQASRARPPGPFPSAAPARRPAGRGASPGSPRGTPVRESPSASL